VALFDSFFRRRQPPLIGLDISSSSVKLAELDRNADGTWVLERFASEPLELGCVVDGNIERFDAVSEVVKKLIRKSGTRAKHVALALPSSAVITKKIIVPGNLSDAELELQVESEATQYIPFPLEEVSLDFCILKNNDKNKEDVDVLLTATRKERVEELNNLAVLVGLKPVVMDVESYAVRRAAEPLIEVIKNDNQDHLVALIKIGARNFNLQIVRHEEVLHDSDYGFGGYQLTQLIAKSYGVSMEEAELKKKTLELSEDYAEVILKPYIHNLAEDIRRALQFFFTSSPFSKIDLIALYGGGACVQGLSMGLESHIKVPVKTINPFEGMQISSGISKNKMDREATMYLAACGLAMRRFLL